MSETRHADHPFPGVPANTDPQPGGWGWQVVPHSDGTQPALPANPRTRPGWEIVRKEPTVEVTRRAINVAKLKRAAKMALFTLLWIGLSAMLLGVLLAVISKFV